MSNDKQDKVIPILPCPDIREQVAFYQQLGFEVLGIYTSPNPYAAMKRGTMEIHFYGSRKIIPAENSSMCYLSVVDVDAVYAAFAGAMKKHTGKVPRAGIPRITKVHDLKYDRRFTLADMGGNTFYIGTPVKEAQGTFFRTMKDEGFAKKFAALYDVVYSKQDCEMAAAMLPKYAEAQNLPDALDKAKYLLVVLEIQQELKQPPNDAELKALIETHKNSGEDWNRIHQKYLSVMQEE